MFPYKSAALGFSVATAGFHKYLDVRQLKVRHCCGVQAACTPVSLHLVTRNDARCLLGVLQALLQCSAHVISYSQCKPFCALAGAPDPALTACAYTIPA